MNTQFNTALAFAREASERLAAVPAVKRRLVQTEESAQNGAARASLQWQERAAWLYAAIGRAVNDGDTAATRALEQGGFNRGFLNALVFDADTLRQAAESGNMDSIKRIYQNHFNADGSARKSTQ